MLDHGNVSLAESLMDLPVAEQQKILTEISDEDADQLLYDWEFWRRPDQIIPATLPNGKPWRTAVANAGRGWGKTEVGSQWLRDEICGPSPLIAGPTLKTGKITIIGETAADVRDYLVEGESGLLQAHPRAFRPEYVPSKRRLTWPNGAIAVLFNGREPEGVRGQNCERAWLDEFCKYRYPETVWDNLQFALRIGNGPRALITTTPKPLKLYRRIKSLPRTVVIGGSTYANRTNLAPEFLETMVEMYEGTSRGGQELHAKDLEEAEGAIWSRDDIDWTRIPAAQRHKVLESLTQVVVGLDPMGSKARAASEAGIVAAGLGPGPSGARHCYVLDDVSDNLTASGWAQRAVDLLRRHQGNKLVAEVNYGGDMVRETLQSQWSDVPVSLIHARKGKRLRAEPVQALYEQGKVSHLGSFPELEDEMTTWEPNTGQESPNRLDAMVYAVAELMLNSREFF